MKKFIIGLSAIAMLGFQSCSDVLDIDPSRSYSESTVYSSVKNLDLYVKDFYGIFYSNADILVGSNLLMDDGCTDLVKYSWYNIAEGTVNKFFYGDVKITVDNNFRSNWDGMYTFIRKFNEYLVDVNNGYGKNISSEELAVRTAEVRFMRAFAYQELVLRHGGVILRIDENRVEDQNDRAKARSSEAECWDFILNEYKKAAADLPYVWEDNSIGTNVGRLTKGAAYGMMARAALYAKRWQDALDACEEVKKLEKDGYYQLLPGTTYAEYNKIFTDYNNKELILSVNFEKRGKQHLFNQYFCPPSDYVNSQLGKGSVGAAATPTDEYASSFDINVGGQWQAFSWDNVASYPEGPWKGRDPRFYASILYNEAPWNGRQLEIYDGGNDGFMEFSTSASQDMVRKSTTGYLFRKFVKEDKTIDFAHVQSDQYWIEMRLAEIYLISSEAYARLDKFKEAYIDLNVIRNRVGMPMLSQKNTWDAYLDDLSKERICELGMEGHRYFDLVRWDKAYEVLNNKRLHGVKATKGLDKFTYERIECDVKTRYFSKKYCVFPIPSFEIRTNLLCEQTDIWK